MYPKLRAAQREYTVAGWREREKLNVRLMPKCDKCSKSTKWPKLFCVTMSQARERRMC